MVVSWVSECRRPLNGALWPGWCRSTTRASACRRSPSTRREPPPTWRRDAGPQPTTPFDDACVELFDWTSRQLARSQALVKTIGARTEIVELPGTSAFVFLAYEREDHAGDRQVRRSTRQVVLRWRCRHRCRRAACQSAVRSHHLRRRSSWRCGRSGWAGRRRPSRRCAQVAVPAPRLLADRERAPRNTVTPMSATTAGR